MQVPEGMVSAKKFAEANGLDASVVIEGIKKGVYQGDKIDEVWYVKARIFEGQQPVATSTSNSHAPEGASLKLYYLLYGLAGLSLVGCLIFASNIWPSDVYHPEPIAYTVPLFWVIAGVVQFSLFAAIGKGLQLLEDIRDNMTKSA